MQVTVTFDYPDGLITRYGVADAAATVAARLNEVYPGDGAEPLQPSPLTVQVGAHAFRSDPILGEVELDPKKGAFLVVTYDVTGLTEAQRGELGAEAHVQSESSDGHPTVDVWSVTTTVIPHGSSRG